MSEVSELSETSKRNLVVYVSGKYSTGEINENIKMAREAAIFLWEAGYTCLCPHLNTYHFERDCSCIWENYIEGDLVLVERCDILYMLPGWEDSLGANKERNLAKKMGKRIVYSKEELIDGNL